MKLNLNKYKPQFVYSILFISIFFQQAMAEKSLDNIKVQADNMQMPSSADDNRSTKMKFIGNVLVKNKNLSIQSDVFVILKRRKKIILMEAVGNVKVYDKVEGKLAKKLNVKSGSELKAESNKIRLLAQSNKITFQGNAEVQWQNNIITGDKIEFNLNTYQLTTSSLNTSKPTKLVFTPQKKIAETKKIIAKEPPKIRKLKKNHPKLPQARRLKSAPPLPLKTQVR